MNFEDNVQRLFIKPEDKTLCLVHAAMGIAGEAGEVVDAVKKHWVYGKPLDVENILEECGDILFYVSACLNLCGHSLNDAMTHNIDKLNKRYPHGYTDQDAIARADK